MESLRSSELKMKNLTDESELSKYLAKIETKLYWLMVFIKLKLMD